jgi:hypothetical protein
VLGEAPQLALLLHVTQRPGIALEVVGHDHPRVVDMLASECTSEEVPSRLLVPLGAELKIDGLAGAIDRLVEVASAARPECKSRQRVTGRYRGAGDDASVSRVRGKALNPAVHGRVIHRDAPVSEHPFEIAIADRELQVSPHGLEDHLGREAKTVERPGGSGHGRYSRRDGSGSTAPTQARCLLNATDSDSPTGPE